MRLRSFCFEPVPSRGAVGWAQQNRPPRSILVARQGQMCVGLRWKCFRLLRRCTSEAIRIHCLISLRWQRCQKVSFTGILPAPRGGLLCGTGPGSA
jgi:hypothetical protein